MCKGVYLLISNRVDVPEKAIAVYQKRWRTESFFHNAKQELGLTQFHSTNEDHVQALGKSRKGYLPCTELLVKNFLIGRNMLEIDE